MSGIGNNSPFTPNNPQSTPQGNVSPSTPETRKENAPKQQMSQKDTVGNVQQQTPQQQEKMVEHEVVNELASLNDESVVENELQESETSNENGVKESKGEATHQSRGKTATGIRRPPVNVAKMTLNEDGQQTETPDDSIAHLANSLIDGSPESLSEAAEAFANIISDDEDEEGSQKKDEDEESEDEEN